MRIIPCRLGQLRDGQVAEPQLFTLEYLAGGVLCAVIPAQAVAQHRARVRRVTNQLNTSFQMQSRVIDGLMVRFARGQDRGDHAPTGQPVAMWPVTDNVTIRAVRADAP